jgi:hypothetical protein
LAAKYRAGEVPPEKLKVAALRSATASENGAPSSGPESLDREADVALESRLVVTTDPLQERGSLQQV